jgi:hypothetical protein
MGHPVGVFIGTNNTIAMQAILTAATGLLAA